MQDITKIQQVVHKHKFHCLSPNPLNIVTFELITKAALDLCFDVF